MAVLARPSKTESAQQRIETILIEHEKQSGQTLPRPVVIEGDLCDADLDLDAFGLRWISRHCDAVVHNAASLTFRGNHRDGEPWLSNVEGTRRMLALCRCAGIRRFHYVSTAYVCGLRTGRILESELDAGQSMGNDYESSKVEAEKLVRAAAFLDAPTIYRPAILVGDSRTGYTSSFHGLYALLKLAHTLVSKVVLGATGGETLVAAFGLTGKERKNFVPVDWVSAVMTHILGRPEHHGKAYHLVARRPLPVSTMAKLLQDAVERYSTLAKESDASRCDGQWFARNFRAQMEIYQSYWRDDPEFDDTNTAAAAPHLPCAELDDAMLMRMAKFAIETNFGKRRAARLAPERRAALHAPGFLRSGAVPAPRPNGEAAREPKTVDACLPFFVDKQQPLPGGKSS
jgi:nucleoside-diphosphate-sugar epimerase